MSNTTYKKWTTEEECYLQDHWGSKSVTLIAKHLNRPYQGVRDKATKLGLLDPTLHYDGITVQQLALALKVSTCITRKWIYHYKFPAKQKLFAKKKKIYVVSFGDFWDWALEHPHLINFAKLEPLLLGREPDWVKEKRLVDKQRFQERRLWTQTDISRLISLVQSYRYTYPEIAFMLKRTEASIKRKLKNLDIKARPLPLDKTVKYTEDELQFIIRLLKKGYSFNAIADQINHQKPRNRHKSASGIKAKLERMGFIFQGDTPIHCPESFKQLL